MSKCLRLHTLRTMRRVKRFEPVVRRTGRFVKRHVIDSSVVSFVPSVLNDTLMHHHHVSPNEIIRVVTDEVSVTSLVAVMQILMKLV